MDRAVIFDMDGTIWDINDIAVSAWNRTLKGAGSDRVLSKEDIASMMGKTQDDFAVEFFPDLPHEEGLKIVKDCLSGENEIISQKGARLLGDVRAVFCGIRERGYDVAIVSNCQLDYIPTFMKYYDVEDLVDDYEEYGRTGRSKADNIRLVIERNGYSKYLYVGDTQGDLDACLQADVPFVWAAYGFGTVDDDVKRIDSLEEILALI